MAPETLDLIQRLGLGEGLPDPDLRDHLAFEHCAAGGEVIRVLISGRASPADVLPAIVASVAEHQRRKIAGAWNAFVFSVRP